MQRLRRVGAAAKRHLPLLTSNALASLISDDRSNNGEAVTGGHETGEMPCREYSRRLRLDLLRCSSCPFGRPDPYERVAFCYVLAQVNQCLNEARRLGQVETARPSRVDVH